VTQLVPMAHVANVDQSIDFYTLLGFACESRFSDDDGVTYFARVRCDQADLMLVRASAPVLPNQQAILFYLYSPQVAALRAHLLASGLLDGGPPPSERDPNGAPRPCPQRRAVFQLTRPFYMPEGEIRVHDHDGYCLLIGQLAE
jgi:hypothetical protein